MGANLPVTCALIGHDQFKLQAVKIDGLREMLLRVERAAEVFEFAVVLGQLQRALHVKPAADLQKGLFDIVVFDLHGFLAHDALALHDAAPKPVVVHVCLLAAGRRMRYNNKSVRLFAADRTVIVLD